MPYARWFIALSGPLLHRLIIGPGALPRFYKLFAFAFGAYAIAWIAGWMLVRGHAGSLAGLLAGTALMDGFSPRLFTRHAPGDRGAFRVEHGRLFHRGWLEAGVTEALGTRAGEMLAKLLWGVCYGIGLGAGLGVAFHFCQAAARALIAGSREDEGSRGR